MIILLTLHLIVQYNKVGLLQTVQLSENSLMLHSFDLLFCFDFIVDKKLTSYNLINPIRSNDVVVCSCYCGCILLSYINHIPIGFDPLLLLFVHTVLLSPIQRLSVLDLVNDLLCSLLSKSFEFGSESRVNEVLYLLKH